MKIYNTLSGKKEEFQPISGNKVNMYACGITVSGDAHIGHAFQALVYDIIRKYLVKKGYDVTYARNYTDVDDKIISKADSLGVPADVFAAEMIEKINRTMSRFGVDDPDVWLKATDNIGEIIDFIEGLIETGHAYPASGGSVYFSVESFPSYGALSHRDTEKMLDGVRIDNDENKKSPLDFALWKAAKPGEICWDSPWGKGRPGWHIECSAMNRRAFGDRIDIHGGGRDLIFPHHENEIAQSEALTGKKFANFWIHNGLIKVNGQKMSKSLGNFILLDDLLDRHSAEAVKFALLSNSYHNDINLTEATFADAEKHMLDFYRTMLAATEKFGSVPARSGEIEKAFDAAMDDDFNTSLALSALFGYFKTIKKEIADGNPDAADKVAEIKSVYSLLGLFVTDPAEYISAAENRRGEGEIPEEIKKIVADIDAARAEKNYALSDSLRDELSRKGYEVRFTKNGTEVTKSK